MKVKLGGRKTTHTDEDSVASRFRRLSPDSSRFTGMASRFIETETLCCHLSLSHW